MIIKKSALCVFILLLIFACNNSSQEENHFNQTIEYQPIKTERALLADMVNHTRVARVVADKLIIAEVESSPSIHIFQIDEDGSVEYLKGVGRQGRGPGEYIRLMDIIDSDSLFYAYDGSQFSLTPYDSEGNLRDEKRRELLTQGLPNSIYILDDDNVVASGLYRDSRFKTFDASGKVIESHGDYIVFDKNFTARDNAIAWNSHAGISLDKKYIYLFAENANSIEKYDLSGELVKRIQGKDVPVPDMILRDDWPVDNGGIVAYTNVFSNDEYLYASYSGIARSDTSRNPLYSDLIQKFDWDLNLQKAYQLDHYPAVFTVDDHENIYTVNQSEDGLEIRVGQLN